MIFYSHALGVNLSSVILPGVALLNLPGTEEFPQHMLLRKHLDFEHVEVHVAKFLSQILFLSKLKKCHG